MKDRVLYSKEDSLDRQQQRRWELLAKLQPDLVLSRANANEEDIVPIWAMKMAQKKIQEEGSLLGSRIQ